MEHERLMDDGVLVGLGVLGVLALLFLMRNADGSPDSGAPISANVPIFPGSDWLTLPLHPDPPLLADDFLAEIHQQIGVTPISLARWDQPSGNWVTHTYLTDDGLNFGMAVGEGYLLITDPLGPLPRAPLVLQGFALTSPVPVFLSAGLNFIGLPVLPDGGWRATDALAAIASQTGLLADQITESTGGGTILYVAGSDPEINNFWIGGALQLDVSQRAYLVHIKAGGPVLWTPGQVVQVTV